MFVYSLSCVIAMVTRLALRTVEVTHNTPLFTTICQKLHQATGKHSYAVDSEDVVSFVSSTNRKAAILVSV